MLAIAERVREAQSAPPPERPQSPAIPAAAPISSPQPDLAELAAAVGLIELAPEPAAAEAPASSAAPEPEPAAVSASQPLLAPQPPSQVLLAAPAPMALLAAPISTPAPISEVELATEAGSAPVAANLAPPQSAPAAPEPAGPPIATTQFGLRFPVAASGATKPIQSPEPVPGPAAAPPQTPDVAETLPSGSWLRLAPLQDYTATAERNMKPVPPPVQILATDSGPRITLPGPILPPKLARFQEGNIVTVIGDSPRGFRLPGWVISATVMLSVLLIAATLVFYFFPVAKSSAETKTPVEEAHLVTPTAASHPLAQFIEVTGFRFVVDLNKKSEIHYLVVNHSAADVSDVTVFVTLRTAGSKAGQPPLARFSFRAPSLGPFESKEMTSSIEKIARPVSLPDWQDLRSEIQIAQ